MVAHLQPCDRFGYLGAEQRLVGAVKVRPGEVVVEGGSSPGCAGCSYVTGSEPRADALAIPAKDDA